MEDFLKKGMAWGKLNFPGSSIQQKAAFANTIQYLCTGASGGYGGPSVREHCVSWSLAGDGYNLQAKTSMGTTLTMQYPDGRIPRAGEWEFEKACEFASPICFGGLPAIASRIYKEEYCFDDDPADIEELEKRGK